MPRRARAELAKAGAGDARVTILSAYKQGFLWLTEQVIPELKGKGARSVQIRVASYHPDLIEEVQVLQVPSRWLHELYPVDEIFQRDLGIAKDASSSSWWTTPRISTLSKPTTAQGRSVYRGAFSPKFVEREYLDKFPGWSRVQVTTGWITASVDGNVTVDERIATDPERFWDYYQSKVLSRVYDHVMKTTDNKPLPDKQPFHRDLNIEVWMSEPDFRIGIDEELISSLEVAARGSVFRHPGFLRRAGAHDRQAPACLRPGMIYPIIHPDRPGQPGQARSSLCRQCIPKARSKFPTKRRGSRSRSD